MRTVYSHYPRMLGLPPLVASTAEKCRRNWFLLCIVVAIMFAKTAPWIGTKGGPLRPEYTVKYGAVFFIFLNSGLSIRTEEFSKALFQLEIHAFVQLFTLGFVPIFVKGLVGVLASAGLPAPLLTGLQVVSCMPPPVSSAVILTKACEGNEAVAVFNSALGSFLGIVVTPILLLLYVGVSSSVPIVTIFSQLSSTVVLPLMLGSFIRRTQKETLDKRQIPYSTISNLLLLAIIYTTFCDTFMAQNVDVDRYSLLQVAVIVVGLQLALMALVFVLTTSDQFGKKYYAPRDVCAMLFCATHKSLTLGIPMLKIIYHGDPSLPLLSVPLLFYHPTQILLGGLLVPTVKTWMHNAPNNLMENADV